MLKRVFLLLCASLLLASCSSVGLVYGQLPRLAAWWVDRHLDLDRAQARQLDSAVAEFYAWHRREELPQWQALLRQAGTALGGSVSEAELKALEAAAAASVQRSLQRAAPLAQPLLASLRPAQWQRLQARQAERLAEWREAQGGPDGADERAEQFLKSLDRWLGDLSRPTRRLARAEAQGWAFDLPALAQARTDRQAQTVAALRLWAQGDLAGGTALLSATTAPRPAELPFRASAQASLLKVLNAMSPAEREEARALWSAWAADLREAQQR